uniref:Uncharacterized protein n=1 Tax=Glossina austeni TaxID=7395 RepID=A0A1A9VR44_GLOAU
MQNMNQCNKTFAIDNEKEKKAQTIMDTVLGTFPSNINADKCREKTGFRQPERPKLCLLKKPRKV